MKTLLVKYNISFWNKIDIVPLDVWVLYAPELSLNKGCATPKTCRHTFISVFQQLQLEAILTILNQFEAMIALW